ncbi:MAG: DUF4118 domain-containing protein [Gammaproteobacteria bacterium]|nr:DUF4118 domain-containing protein [Gammaproteobacteria bacterium]
MHSLRVTKSRNRIRGYAGAAALVLAGIGTAMIFRRIPSTNLSLLFLLVVLIAAAAWGLGPSIFAGLLSFLALNYLFTPPYYTLSVAEDNDLATLFFFLAAAALTGQLAARMRREAAENRTALDRVSALLDFSGRMSAAQTVEQVLESLTDRLAATCGAPAAALMPDEQAAPTVRARRRSNQAPVFDSAAASEVWSSGVEHSIRRDAWLYVPLTAGTGRIGLVALGVLEVQHAQKRLIEALCEQATIAIERIQLEDRLRKAQLESEAERLRTALLSSVSHDLRTPLAAIVGSATSMLDYADAIAPEDARELLEMIRSESERLDRYIQNLLDMTRVDRRDVNVTRDWVDLNDVAAAAVSRLGTALRPFRLRVDVAPDAALVFVHRALVEQLLVNLLDNAAGFSPPGGSISVVARSNGNDIRLDVIDEGPGIPEEDGDRIFEPFYRGTQGDRGRSGTGLGLAISRSVAAAHGGTIAALPMPQGGTRMRVTLPQPRPPQQARVAT